MLTDDPLNRMSDDSRLDETGSSDAPPRIRRRLMAEEGREKEGQSSSTVRGAGGVGGGTSDHRGGSNCRMSSLNEVDLLRCLWRGTAHHHHHHHHHHHQRVPSTADALSSCSGSSISSSSSIGRRFRPATVAKILRDAEKSYASISSLRRSLKPPAGFGLAARSEFVTSLANDVKRVNDDDVGLRPSVTQIPHGGIVLESRSQRQTEESSGRTGIAGRKEGGLEPSRRKQWGTISRTKVETEEKGKRREDEAEEVQRQMSLSEAENVENIKDGGSMLSNVHVDNKEQSKQVSGIDAEKEEGGLKEEEEDVKKKQWGLKEEEWRRELSSFAIDFLDTVNYVAPEDKASRTIIREEQVNGANRSSINQTEPSGTVRLERPVPRPPQQPDAIDLQKRLSEAVSRDRLPKTEVEPDVGTRCHEQRVQHDVTVAIGSEIRCPQQQVIESFQAEDRAERITKPEQHARETVTETEFKIASVSATYRIIGQKSPLDSFATRRHFGPRSTAVRSAEPQPLPSSSRHRYSPTSKVANEPIRRRDGIRVRDVIIGDSKLRLVGNCKRTHPQPNRASILRQVAAASSSSASSFSFSSASRSTIGSPGMVRRNSTYTAARNRTPPLVLIQGPFPKDRRTQQTTYYSKRKPVSSSSLIGNNSSSCGRAKLHPDSILIPLKPSRPKYQKTRTFLVNSASISSPRGSSRRRSTSSYQSPSKRNLRPTTTDSSGKRVLKELRPKQKQQQQQRQQQQQQQQHQKQQQKQQKQLSRSFFIHNFCSTQINNARDDDAHHYNHHQPQQQQLLQQRKTVLLHRTATRTLVARVQER